MPVHQPLSNAGMRQRLRGESMLGTSLRRVALLAVLLGTLVFGRQNVVAQQQDAAKPADTSSPRATLNSFIDACNEFHRRIEEDHYFDRTSEVHGPLALKILDCLDASELPEFERLEAAGEAAVCLKEILDRVELPADSDIPGAAAIRATDEGEGLSQWRIPGTRITIVRIENGPQRHEWLFSAGTVQRAPDYFQEVKFLPYRETGPATSPGLYDWYVTAPGNPTVAKLVDWLPAWFRAQKLGMAIWKWLGLLTAALVAFLIMGLSYWLQGRLVRRFGEGALVRYCLTIALPIFAMLVPLGFNEVVYEHLTVRGSILYAVSFIANMTALLVSPVVVFGAGNRIAAVIIASPKVNPQGLNAQFVRIVSKLLGVVFVVIVFLEGGNYLGIPVTTLIASAGVSGLAIALAAQDTLKTLFGTIVLLADKPFRVGDRIVFKKYDGVVENIGLRSTRLRLLTGHEAAIPNDELARTDIENVGRRPYIRRVANIHIPLDTPRENLQRAVTVIRDALKDHEGMDPDRPPRVYFLDFDPTAFVIRVFYWYKPPDYWDFLAMGEKVNFEVFRAFEEHGIKLSLPFRVTHTSIESEQQPVEVTLTNPGSAA
jgi:MscS family membrane protein